MDEYKAILYPLWILTSFKISVIMIHELSDMVNKKQQFISHNKSTSFFLNGIFMCIFRSVGSPGLWESLNRCVCFFYEHARGTAVNNMETISVHEKQAIWFFISLLCIYNKIIDCTIKI